MTIERINPATLTRPSGFSHAVTATGRLVFLAGQIAVNAAGEITGATVTAQFEQALGNLLEALRAAGGSPGQLASLTIYTTDLADYRAHGGELGEIWARLAGPDYPAMAAIGVSQLWDTAALVELQGFAVLP